MGFLSLPFYISEIFKVKDIKYNEILFRFGLGTLLTYIGHVIEQGRVLNYPPI